MLSRLDEQTLVGGKHVARQQLPTCPNTPRLPSTG
jgi:hypothetical protein